MNREDVAKRKTPTYVGFRSNASMAAMPCFPVVICCLILALHGNALIDLKVPREILWQCVPQDAETSEASFARHLSSLELVESARCFNEMHSILPLISLYMLT